MRTEGFGFLNPTEFYDLEHEEYALLQKGRRNILRETEQFHRRAAFIIGAAIGPKNWEQWFDKAWPFGDSKVQVLINERLQEIREEGKKGAIVLATSSLVQDAIKKHKLGRTKNSYRG